MTEPLPLRATAFEKPRLSRIEGDALLITPTADPGEPAVAPTRIPLGDVVEIRLSHEPARFQYDRFRCRLRTRGGAVHTLSNLFWEGPVSETDYSADYRALVGELCRRVAAANPEARFRRGRSRTAMALENGALLLVFAVLIGVWAVLRPPMPAFRILNLVLIVVYVPLAVFSFRKNRPGTFDPLAVPAEILPK